MDPRRLRRGRRASSRPTRTSAVGGVGARAAAGSCKHVWQIDARRGGRAGRGRRDVADALVDERRPGRRAPTTRPPSSTPRAPPAAPRAACSPTATSSPSAATWWTGCSPLFRTGESSVLLFLPLAHVFGRLVEVAAVMAPIKLGHVAGHQEPHRRAGRVPADADPRRAAGLREGLQLGARQGAGRRQGQDLRPGRATPRSPTAARWTPRRARRCALRLQAQDLRPAGLQQAARGARRPRRRTPISGGAPLGERLGHFFRGIGFTVLEGYGLTESCAATAFNPWDRHEDRHGRPAAAGLAWCGSPTTARCCCTASTSSPATGTTRRPTAEALADGWFHTGDIGALDEDGYLTITGRKKEIIVTAGGKNVAPAVIEDRIRAHALVAECMVVGDGPPVHRRADHPGRGVPAPLGRSSTASRPATVAELREDPDAAGRDPAGGGRRQRGGLAGRGGPASSGSWPTSSPRSPGHLTPSLKLKRNVVREGLRGRDRGALPRLSAAAPVSPAARGAAGGARSAWRRRRRAAQSSPRSRPASRSQRQAPRPSAARARPAAAAAPGPAAGPTSRSAVAAGRAAGHHLAGLARRAPRPARRRSRRPPPADRSPTPPGRRCRAPRRPARRAGSGTASRRRRPRRSARAAPTRAPRR